MRVDFYLLNSAEETARWQFACRLLAKAYAQKHQVFVYTEDENAAQQFDQLLWTFNDISFIPHERFSPTTPHAAPVCIGHPQACAERGEILLNLSSKIAATINHYQRIIEIVTSVPEVKALSREHYRYYREQGAEIQTHNI